MVSEIERKSGTIFQCEVCGFGYGDLDTAERCEEYCNTHASCSLEITKKAIRKPSTRVITTLI
jgi:hypothetical protein